MAVAEAMAEAMAGPETDLWLADWADIERVESQMF